MDSETVRKTILPNGLRVLTEHVPYVSSVSLGIWVEAGSRDEYKPHRGILHFIEHMLFKGTEKRTAFELVHSLESVGGQIDAFTSRDITCFFVRCIDEHTEIALDVLGDMLRSSVFDPNAIEKEKGVVVEEIRNVEDTPDELIHDAFGESVWGGHPVGRPILGVQETVVSFQRKDLIDHLREFYTSGSVIVTAAGSLDHDAFVESVKRHIDLPESGGLPRQRSAPPTNPGSARHVDKKIGQTHLCLGTVTCSCRDPRRYDILAANTILGGGMSSRLFQEIRERLGLAYAIYTYVDMLADTGLFGVYLACEPAQAARATELVCDAIRKIKTDGVTQSEVDNARAQMKGGLLMGMESMSKRMSRLAKQEIYFGRSKTVAETIADIEGITRDGIVDLCREMFDVDGFHVVTVGPESDGVAGALERIA